MARPKKLTAQYTMTARVIKTGKDVRWIVKGHPDYAGFRSGYSPAELSDIHVEGAGRLRMTGPIDYYVEVADSGL